jgi:hypothetical protein
MATPAEVSHVTRSRALGPADHRAHHLRVLTSFGASEPPWDYYMRFLDADAEGADRTELIPSSCP